MSKLGNILRTFLKSLKPRLIDLQEKGSYEEKKGNKKCPSLGNILRTFLKSLKRRLIALNEQGS